VARIEPLTDPADNPNGFVAHADWARKLSASHPPLNGTAGTREAMREGFAVKYVIIGKFGKNRVSGYAIRAGIGIGEKHTKNPRFRKNDIQTDIQPRERSRTSHNQPCG
jgi:hypothetical protein